MGQVIVYSDANSNLITIGVGPEVNVVEAASKLVPEGTPYFVVDDSQLPGPALRNAWRLVNGRVVIDPARQAAVQQEAIAAMAVTPRQIRLALHHMGLLEAVNQWVLSAGGDAQIEWEFATKIKRDHPMWDEGAKLLGKTSADIDQLFELATTL